MEKIILASTSPRRKELMTLLPLTFTIKSEEIKEVINKNLTPRQNVENLAYQKAEAVAKKFPDCLVIGCDTVVVLENEIMGKPKDEKDAIRMLQQLSGKDHWVYTGVSLINLNEKINVSFSEATKVKMKALEDSEIFRYIETKEPLDKAGAYGIQGYGALYIENIEGDYYTVMGLPVCKLYKNLLKLNKIKK